MVGRSLNAKPVVSSHLFNTTINKHPRLPISSPFSIIPSHAIDTLSRIIPLHHVNPSLPPLPSPISCCISSLPFPSPPKSFPLQPFMTRAPFPFWKKNTSPSPFATLQSSTQKDHVTLTFHMLGHHQEQPRPVRRRRRPPPRPPCHPAGDEW